MIGAQMNLPDFLKDTTGRIPDHPAIRYEGQTVTFAEMNRKVDAFAVIYTDGNILKQAISLDE